MICNRKVTSMDYKDIGLTKEQYEECIDLIIDKQVNKITDIDWQEICDRYNLPYHYDSLRKANNTVFGGCYIASYLRDKLNNDNLLKPSFNVDMKINKDGTYSSSKLLNMNDKQAKDVNYILKAHGFDTSMWKVVNVRNNTRQVMNRDGEIETLYASNITVKPINDNLSLLKINYLYTYKDINYSLPIIENIYYKLICKSSLSICNNLSSSKEE